jgi:uncharacterized membrane protein
MIRAVVRSLFVVCVLAGVGLAETPAPATTTAVAPAKTAAKPRHHRHHAKKARKARKSRKHHRKHRAAHAAH